MLRLAEQLCPSSSLFATSSPIGRSRAISLPFVKRDRYAGLHDGWFRSRVCVVRGNVCPAAKREHTEGAHLGTGIG
jgi:hypothetical protein